MHVLDLLATIQRNGDISREDAEHVLSYYRSRRVGLVFVDPKDRRAGLQVRHGAALDRDVIRRALAATR